MSSDNDFQHHRIADGGGGAACRREGRHNVSRVDRQAVPAGFVLASYSLIVRRPTAIRAMARAADRAPTEAAGSSGQDAGSHRVPGACRR